MLFNVLTNMNKQCTVHLLQYLLILLKLVKENTVVHC